MRQEEALKVKHQIIEESKTVDGGVFEVIIQIPLTWGWIERVKFAISNSAKKDTYRMEYWQNDETYAYFKTTIELGTSALYHYYFSFEANGCFQYYKKIDITGISSISKEECWKMSVGFDVPDWSKGAVMYQVFLDRFYRGSKQRLEPMYGRNIHKNWDEKPLVGPDANGMWANDFYGGDLQGIIKRLKYIKRLGVNVIYLNPVVASPTNHHYDAGDYEKVDPYFGTNQDLKELCEKAHSYGIKIILDAVFNHTGDDSKYFNRYGHYDSVGAFQSEESPYFDFYKRRWDKGQMDFCYWWGFLNHPVCNGKSPEWIKYICGENGVIDLWFSLGIDGLRLDVEDELDNEFVKQITEAVLRNKQDGFILAEVWEQNPMRGRDDLSSGKGIHTVMNYRVADALVRYYKYTDIWKFGYVFKETMTEYPTETIQTWMNFTSTHDISRVIEIFGCDVFNQNSQWAWNLRDESVEWIRSHQISRQEYKHGKKVFKSYLTVLAFLPGMLSIFYGDEVGLCGIGNLANRAPYPWKHRDKDMLKFTRGVIKARKQEEFLRTADFRLVKIDAEQFVFERYDDEGNKILVISSRTHHETQVDVPKEYKDAKVIFNIKGSNTQKLAPYGAIVLKKHQS